MSRYCIEEHSISKCFLCLNIEGRVCGIGESVLEAIELKQMEECEESDFKCRKCIAKESCDELRDRFTNEY